MSPLSHHKGLTVRPINSDNTAKPITINPHNNAAIYATSVRAAADMVRFGFSLPSGSPSWM